GDGEDVGEGGGRRVVIAQHGQAVGEQPVQVRLVRRGRPLRECASGPTVTHLAVRPVCAGRAGRGLRATAHHSATVGGLGRPLPERCALLIHTGETIPQSRTDSLALNGWDDFSARSRRTRGAPPARFLALRSATPRRAPAMPSGGSPCEAPDAGRRRGPGPDAAAVPGRTPPAVRGGL